MNNNRTYKKLRAALHGLLNYSDSDFQRCFELGGLKPSRAQFDGWKAGEQNKRLRYMKDTELEAFLNGLIYMSRLITLRVPDDFDFAILNLKRDPVTLDVEFDTKPFIEMGVDPEREFNEDEISAMLISLYRLHISNGGAIDPVCEQIYAEVKAEDVHGIVNVISAPVQKQ